MPNASASACDVQNIERSGGNLVLPAKNEQLNISSSNNSINKISQIYFWGVGEGIFVT